jgi:hypothetical protein
MPLELVFSRFTGTLFPAIQKAMEQGGVDPTDRDAFLLLPDVIELMEALRPDEGIGEGMDYLVALGHHAYLTWDAGSLMLPLAPDETEAMLGGGPAPEPDPSDVARAYYAQFPEHRIWAAVVGDAAAEPLDGCFVHTTSGGILRVLGIFGLRPDRIGFSAVETFGPRPQWSARADGAPLFSSTLGAGHLHSLVEGDELLELGWRTLGPAHSAWARVAR